MPVYTLQGPDGRTYKIEGPEGATAEQLGAFITQSRTPAKQETYDPTEGMSGPQKFFAGVGKGMTDVGYGIGQALGLVSREDVQRKRDTDRALMNTGAGTWGAVTGNVAAALPAAMIPGANTVGGAAAIGGVMGLLQPSTSTEETLTNTGLGVVGGAAGQKIGQGVGRLMGGNTNANAAALATPGKAGAKASVTGSVNTSVRGGGSGFGTVDPTDVGGLSSSQQSIMDWGRKQGFRLTPGQASGSRSLQQLEAKLESQPMTSGTFNRIKDANQTRLNQIAARAIGENADEVSAEVLEQAHNRIGNIYKMIANDRSRAINPDDFLGRLQEIEMNYEGLIYNANGDAVSVLNNPLVKRMFGYAEKGQATGKQLQDLASRMGKAAKDQMTSANGNRQLGMALFEAKELADDLLEQGLTGQSLKAFQEARSQYRNLMLLTSRQGIVNPASGNVQGGSLASALQQQDRLGYLFNRNQGDLYNAARFAQAFKPVVGDSGTATRSMINNAMDLVTQVPINVATSAYASSPMVSMAANVGRGVAPGTFTPDVLRYTNLLSRSGGIGLLNAPE